MPQVPTPVAPKIFGVNVQVGSPSKSPAESVQYTSASPLVVNAIVSSNVTLQSVQIRFANSGQNLTEFSSINMDLQQFNGSKTTYLANATIPSENMTGAYTTYWIWARNSQGFVANSPQYLIGTTPTYPVNATISTDAKAALVQGNSLVPTIYLTNNSTGPIYGSLSLIVNGTVVSQTPGEVFNTGLSATDLGWTIPISYQNTNYTTSIIGEFYGTTVQSQNRTVVTIPPFRAMTLPQLGPLEPIRDGLGNILGEPVGISSTFESQAGYSYKVVAPDGACIIGMEGPCLVQSVSSGNKTASVFHGNQSDTVEYASISGKMQRFSITSSEPLSGSWKVQIEKSGSVQEEIMSKVIAKIRYADHS